VKSDDELEFQIESGSTVSRVYPWMTAQQYQRPLTVIETVEAESEQASGSCNIAANPARDSITAVLRITKLNKVDVMGALPQKTSRKMRQTDLVDTLGPSATNIAGLCNNCCPPLKAKESAKLPCCDVKFCSTKCIEDA
jgi:hypothetical protein